MELLAKYTLFAEGCRGHLGKQVEAKFGLRAESDPQTYALGIKEPWEVDAEQHEKGLVMHTFGWPMKSDTYGGGFIYHFGENLVSVGLVVGLGYKNPFLAPFEEMQRMKTHPRVAPLFKGGKAPWTLHNTADHLKLKPAAECQPIVYPKPDGVLTFDRLSSVFLSNTHHEENQPCHLQLKDANVPIGANTRSEWRT